MTALEAHARVRGRRARTSGLAVAALRSRPTATAGAFAAMATAATVVVAAVTVLIASTGLPAGPARSALSDMGAAFTITTIYLSIFVVGQAMALAVAQRDREHALLRAVGAGPWQLRRAVAAEALAAALVAVPVGYGAGTLVLHAWWTGMAAHGVLPASLPVPAPGIGAASAGGGVALVSSQLGGLLAAHRAARARPAAALGRAEAGGGGIGRIRAVLAAVVFAGAVFLTVLISTQGESGAEAAPMVLLAYLVSVGLGGPWLGRIAAGVLGRPLGRLTGISGELAVAACRARSRRLSSAITPLGLATAFLGVKVASWFAGGADWTEIFGAGLVVGFVGLVAVNTLVVLGIEQRQECALLRRIGAGRGQIRLMLGAEAAIAITTGFAIGAAVAAAVASAVPLG